MCEGGGNGDNKQNDPRGRDHEHSPRILSPPYAQERYQRGIADKDCERAGKVHSQEGLQSGRGQLKLLSSGSQKCHRLPLRHNNKNQKEYI